MHPGLSKEEVEGKVILVPATFGGGACRIYRVVQKNCTKFMAP